MLVVFGSTEFVSRGPQYVNQVSGHFAVHGDTFFDIVNNGRCGKLKGLRRRNFVGFAVSSGKVAVNVHTVLTGEQRYFIGQTDVA